MNDTNNNYHYNGVLKAITISNNEAAYMIARGQYHAAFQVLQGSLKEGCASLALLVEGADSTQRCFEDNFCACYIHPAKNVASDLTTEHGDNYFLHPFTVSFGGYYNDHQANNIEARLRFLTAVVLFNLAITSHRQGLVTFTQGSSNASCYHRRTKNLYRYALHYMDSLVADRDTLDTDCHYVAQLIMTVCHNTAAMALHEGLLSEYDEWKDRLFAVFFAVETFLEEDIYLHFRASLAIMSSTTVVAAQAA
mmetsp:Transcript_602/g.1162  ORF Transcript_602/g.1162 Transcript_602/m.1162 type:complete len:251 (-) Transcript_602:164-916(-)